MNSTLTEERVHVVSQSRLVIHSTHKHLEKQFAGFRAGIFWLAGGRGSLSFVDGSNAEFYQWPSGGGGGRVQQGARCPSLEIWLEHDSLPEKLPLSHAVQHVVPLWARRSLRKIIVGRNILI
jgi:hypothetical protein